MKKLSLSVIYRTSLAIFAMLFGAGNLVLPPRLGMLCGSLLPYGLAGFVLTGVFVPFLGLIAIILFHGNYRDFFNRIGTIPGFLMTLFCMAILGPVLIMPRIVTLSYAMLVPFMPGAVSLGLFSVLFLSLTFLATYKPAGLLDLIGKFLSPLKVLCILTIIAIGITSGQPAATTTNAPLQLFFEGIKDGYLTVDLLGTIFFGSIIMSLLLGKQKPTESIMKNIMATTTISGTAACSFLALIYAGLSYLGAFHGAGLEHLNESEIFSQLCFKILGYHGAALIGITVFLACFITAIALTAVVGQYVQKELLQERVSYPLSLALVLIGCLIPSLYGFAAIVAYAKPMLFIVYPILLAITLCNLLYKLFGFTYIKTPVLFVALIVLGHAYYEKQQKTLPTETIQATIGGDHAV